MSVFGQETGQDVLERFMHELVAALGTISQVEMLPEGIVRHMPDSHELFGLKARAILWQNTPGQLPFETQVNSVLRGALSTLRKMSVSPAQTHPCPDRISDMECNLSYRLVRFKFFDFVFTLACQVTSYSQTGEHGGGEGVLGIYIGIPEDKME